MTAAKSVSATFNVAPVNYTLSVSKSGSGTVSGSGINCGTTCSASYTAGTSVTLTAAPATGQTFAGWGGACSGTGTCTVSMTAAKSAVAEFSPPTPIFIGILGGGIGNLDDAPGKSIGTLADVDIATYLKKQLGSDFESFKPTSMDNLRAIAANNNAGGLFALAYYTSGRKNYRSFISEAGNSDLARFEIETFMAKTKNGFAIIAGHSAGGGDVQNLGWKLKKLGITINLSAQLDSVEVLSGDAKIASNVSRAMGFYQNEGLVITRGEANINAEDAAKTTVTNIRIDKPLGPSDPGKFPLLSNAYHRNMDNDERGWGFILNHVQTKLK